MTQLNFIISLQRRMMPTIFFLVWSGKSQLKENRFGCCHLAEEYSRHLQFTFIHIECWKSFFSKLVCQGKKKEIKKGTECWYAVALFCHNKKRTASEQWYFDLSQVYLMSHTLSISLLYVLRSISTYILWHENAFHSRFVCRIKCFFIYAYVYNCEHSRKVPIWTRTNK